MLFTINITTEISINTNDMWTETIMAPVPHLVKTILIILNHFLCKLTNFPAAWLH